MRALFLHMIRHLHHLGLTFTCSINSSKGVIQVGKGGHLTAYT